MLFPCTHLKGIFQHNLASHRRAKCPAVPAEEVYPITQCTFIMITPLKRKPTRAGLVVFAVFAGTEVVTVVVRFACKKDLDLTFGFSLHFIQILKYVSLTDLL